MSASFPRSIALLAHQGGWDEIMLVGGPIVVIVVVLAIAKRRVDASFELDRADPSDAEPSGAEPDGPQSDGPAPDPAPPARDDES